MARMMIAPLAAALLALGLGAPVAAQDRPAVPPGKPPLQDMTPQEQALQGLELVLKGLEGMMRQFPYYAPPEITPEGDIILRRLDPQTGKPRTAPVAPKGGARI